MDFKIEEHRIYMNNEEGNLIAEVTFPSIAKDIVDINHTFVDPSLRGKGVASKLLETLSNKLRAENKKAIPTCPYAITWFERNPNHQDILKK